jgi:peptidoglycan hydrolase-like protein with peptidoglycan-binding domain
MSVYGGRDLGITRSCDVGSTSEHKEGRAFDWGLNAADKAEKAVADQFLAWLLAPGPDNVAGYNARRLGVMYVIWNGKIWASYRAADGWRKYTGGEAHADHIHISLSWAGAMKRTSWWTGKAAATDYGPCVAIQGDLAPKYTAARYTPCPTPISYMSLTGKPVLKRDSTGGYVRQLQTLLRVKPVSGWFGPTTDTALRAYQSSHGIRPTGKTWGKTWDALRSGAPAVSSPTTSTPSASAPVQPSAFAHLSQRMTYKVRRGDSLSRIASRWRSSVAAIKSVNDLSGDTIRPGQVLTIPVKSWLTKYSHTTLRKGRRGNAVKALQTALHMKSKYRTGLYGGVTARRVNRFKAKYGWSTNGIAGSGVWRKLGA